MPLNYSALCMFTWYVHYAKLHTDDFDLHAKNCIAHYHIIYSVLSQRIAIYTRVNYCSNFVWFSSQNRSSFDKFMASSSNESQLFSTSAGVLVPLRVAALKSIVFPGLPMTPLQLIKKHFKIRRES